MSIFACTIINSPHTIASCQHTLLLFATYLSQRVTPPTIKVYLCAVRNLHLQSGFPNPMEHVHRLPYLLRGIKRLYSQERQTRLPITPIRSSKTDPFRQGCKMRLAPSGHPSLCPSKALTEYLRRTHHPHSSPLFVWASGSSLSTLKFDQVAGNQHWNRRTYAQVSHRCGNHSLSSRLTRFPNKDYGKMVERRIPSLHSYPNSNNRLGGQPRTLFVHAHMQMFVPLISVNFNHTCS